MQRMQSWPRIIICTILAFFSAILAHGQTTVALSLYGAFNESTSTDVNDTAQSPSNAAGGIIELRQIRNPFIGYEATYSYHRANQAYSTASFAVCGVCAATTSWIPVSANAHELTGAWVASLKVGNIRPFALAGGGLLLNVPVGSQATTTTLITACGGGNPGCVPGTVTTSTTPTSTSTNGVFVYGAGLDWKLPPRLGLRLQYRGSLSKAPALVNGLPSTNALTSTAEPVIGVYFRL